MIAIIEKYKNEANVHRTALVKLPQRASFPPDKKKEIEAAYVYGKRFGIMVQAPIAGLAAYFYAKVVPKFNKEGKLLCYTAGLCCCGPVYSLSKAWGWHRAFEKVEPIVKDHVLDPDFEITDKT